MSTEFALPGIADPPSHLIDWALPSMFIADKDLAVVFVTNIVELIDWFICITLFKDVVLLPLKLNVKFAEELQLNIAEDNKSIFVTPFNVMLEITFSKDCCTTVVPVDVIPDAEMLPEVLIDATVLLFSSLNSIKLGVAPWLSYK